MFSIENEKRNPAGEKKNSVDDAQGDPESLLSPPCDNEMKMQDGPNHTESEACKGSDVIYAVPNKKKFLSTLSKQIK